MNLTLIRDTDAAGEPLSLPDAAEYLRLEDGVDLSTVQSLITASRGIAEGAHGRQLAVKQWKLVLDRWPNAQNVFTYPYSSQYTDPILFQFQVGPSFISLLDPLISVDSVTYRKADGTTVTLSENADYIVDTDKHPGCICPLYGKTWPGDALWPSSSVSIVFTAGMVPTSDAWVADRAYVSGNVVASGGASWIAKSSSTGVTPGSDATKWAAVSSVPTTVKQGMLLLISQYYESRIPFDAIRFSSELPYSVTALFNNGKLWKF